MAITVPRMTESESEAWLGLVGITQLLPAALDAQLQSESSLTHFEFMVLTMLRVAPDSTLRMTALAKATNATLPRLSHVCSRLERRGLVERRPCPGDRRATNVSLTGDGRRTLIHAIPGHIDTVRRLVIDALTSEQIASLAQIAAAIRTRLDPSSCSGPG